MTLIRRTAALALLLAPAILAQTSTPTADPIDWHWRWDNYVERTYGWQKVGYVIGETSFDQLFQLNKCGRPPYCFPHEISAALTRRTARTTIELGVGALLHEDIRRQPSGLPGFGKRLAYAFLHAPLAKGTDGEWRPAYSRFAGSLGGFIVSSELRGRPLTGSRFGEDIGWSAEAYFQDALWTEFEPDLRKMGARLLRRMRRRGDPSPARAMPLDTAIPSSPETKPPDEAITGAR